MNIKSRTKEEQELLNGQMRRKDVLEWALFESLHAEPASLEQVKRFLTAAPPEVFVLLYGLVPPPSPATMNDESLYESRIVQGFVGAVMAAPQAWPSVSVAASEASSTVPRAGAQGDIAPRAGPGV